MPIIAIKKTKPLQTFPTKKAAAKFIQSVGGRVSDYDFMYVYKEQRWTYAPAYALRHREAALRSYHKNKTTTRPRGRPRKIDGIV